MLFIVKLTILEFFSSTTISLVKKKICSNISWPITSMMTAKCNHKACPMGEMVLCQLLKKEPRIYQSWLITFNYRKKLTSWTNLPPSLEIGSVLIMHLKKCLYFNLMKQKIDYYPFWQHLVLLTVYGID